MNTIDELLKTPYWIIDILPKRVPKHSPGQYFAIEDYFLKDHLTEIKQKHINLVLKLNCYLDISVENAINPAPSQIEKTMNEQYVYILLEDSMILSEPDDTYLTLYNPDEQLLELVTDLATSEGLFVWKGAKKRVLETKG